MKIKIGTIIKTAFIVFAIIAIALIVFISYELHNLSMALSTCGM